jgi:hypothetical protein
MQRWKICNFISFKKRSCLVFFFRLDIFLTLHFIYLSSFFVLIFIFMQFCLGFFSLDFFWKKNYYFLFFILEIFIIICLIYLYHSFYFYLYSFMFFFFIFFFEKLLYKTKRKWCFIITIATLFHFSTTLKINLRSYTSLLTHTIFTLSDYI